MSTENEFLETNTKFPYTKLIFFYVYLYTYIYLIFLHNGYVYIYIYILFVMSSLTFACYT